MRAALFSKIMAMELVELTTSEIQEKGQELAQAVSELYRLRSEKKEVMSDFKNKIDRKEKEISELTLTVNSGKELRVITFFSNQYKD